MARRRIRTIAKAVDRVLCLLPFEKALYDRHGVAADFVGHPMADRLPEHPDKAAARQTLGFGGGPVVAVLPGSRSGEVRRLAPIFAAAARHVVDAVPDAQFVTPVAAPGLRTAIVAALDAAGLRDRCVLLEGRSEDAMTAADVVLLASGTAALESALLGRPTVAAYRLAPMSYAIVKGLRLLRLTHVTLPNLLTETPLVPEFLQSAAQPAAIGDTVVALLRDPARRACIRDEFAKLRSQLARDTDRRAADAVASLATG